MLTQQPNITLGTAGHVDHGKTALVKNLTGCDTDTLKEEKERGMSIELGFAPCTIADWQVGIVDVPGHEDFVKTMVAGASGMDAVIFVVAADDGVMPQTREHLEILTLLGIRHGLVALTKSDRVSLDHLDLAREEIRELLASTFLRDAPILPVSNITGAGYDAFLEALQDMVHAIRPKPTDGLFRMPIERTFSVKGYGTVVSGIPVSGQAKLGDELVLLPQGAAGRLKTIQVYKSAADQVLAGQCTALNVPQLDHAVIARGNVLTVPGYFTAAEWYTCQLRLLPHEGLFLKNASQVKFHTGTSEVMATAYLPTGSAVAAGEQCIVQFHLVEPIVAGPADRFIVRSLSPVRTIGGGIVVEATDRRCKRNKPEILQDLADRAVAVADNHAFVEYCVRTAEDRVITAANLAKRTKIPQPRITAILAALVQQQKILELPGPQYAHTRTLAAAEEQVLQVVADFHKSSSQSPGITPDELLQALQIDKRLFDVLLSQLKTRSKLVDRASRLALPTHQAVFAQQDQALMDQVEALFAKTPFAPPTVQEVATAVKLSPTALDKTLKLLVQHQRLTKVGVDLYFHKPAIDKAREITIDFITKEGKLESVKFKYLLDTSRKYAIPLLDYFDKIGLTRQVNHTRYLREKRQAP
jgi:selenocysteine-specific elongation factor